MSTLRETIVKREQTPISFNDIKRALPSSLNLKFIMLDDLSEHPASIVGDADAALILCTMHTLDGTATKINHWVSIIKHGRGFIFFDPLGHSIERLTAKLHMTKHSLINWAKDKAVAVNSVRLQKWDSHINTCGCHQIVRLLKRKLNNRQYTNWLKHGFLPPDQSVAMLCWSSLIHE